MTDPYITDDGKPDDRAWLYDQVHDYITKRSNWEAQVGSPPQPRADRQIYQTFAPQYGSHSLGRKSWTRKNRSTQRAMLAAVLRRLIADGKIKVHSEEDLNYKSMHGMDRRNLHNRQQLFGKEIDGKVRTYTGTNVLEAIAQILGPL